MHNTPLATNLQHNCTHQIKFKQAGICLQHIYEQMCTLVRYFIAALKCMCQKTCGISYITTPHQQASPKPIFSPKTDQIQLVQATEFDQVHRNYPRIIIIETLHNTDWHVNSQSYSPFPLPKCNNHAHTPSGPNYHLQRTICIKALPVSSQVSNSRSFSSQTIPKFVTDTKGAIMRESASTIEHLNA
jgi:hypothetical protein